MGFSRSPFKYIVNPSVGLSQNSAPASTICSRHMMGLVIVGPSRKFGSNSAALVLPTVTIGAFTVQSNGILFCCASLSGGPSTGHLLAAAVTKPLGQQCASAAESMVTKVRFSPSTAQHVPSFGFGSQNS